MVPNKAQSLTGPRLDKQDRLFKRFYEPLVLLYVLDLNGELVDTPWTWLILPEWNFVS
jgi:hypothetical protein